VPAQDLVEIPLDWTELEAAGATLVYLTAYQALTMWGPLPPSAVVLVTGASGGVGVAAVQLAAALGHKVVALSRSPEKCRRLEALGATATFNPEDPKWSLTLKTTLAPRQVDLAIDNIGGKLLPQVIYTLGELGRVSLVGRLAGPVPSFNTATLFFRRIRMGGVAVHGWSNAESRAAWRQVLDLLARAGARPQVDKVFPFDQLPQAFERLVQGPMGKVLLALRSSEHGTSAQA
jgi:NADPH2:quinone reductase